MTQCRNSVESWRDGRAYRSLGRVGHVNPERGPVDGSRRDVTGPNGHAETDVDGVGTS